LETLLGIGRALASGKLTGDSLEFGRHEGLGKQEWVKMLGSHLANVDLPAPGRPIS
jgi:hypothetical protein